MSRCLLGRVALVWYRHERQSDRYGTVTLPRKLAGLARPLLGQRGRLVAVVAEGRKSTHIGDLFRGLSQRAIPTTGEERLLGEGILFGDKGENGELNVGVSPGGGRGHDWLDPQALYDLHESLVDLYFEESP